MDMSVNEFIDEMKKIQAILLNFLDQVGNSEEKYQNLIQIFDDIKIHDNQFKIKPLLYLIINITNNYHRGSAFFSKIEQILQLFKDDMRQCFSNQELFHIFKSNKRLLLFLLEENLLIIDEFIVKKIVNNKKYINSKYPQYFQPEIQPLINEKWFPKYNKDDLKLRDNEWVEDLKKELPNDFYLKRKIGENDGEICKLIQKDLIKEFIVYINKNTYPINSTINPSIYETNHFLLKKRQTTLIEYASFSGSIQIFKYLNLNGVELKPSLWIYAVHGQNPEIINFLEENKVLPSKNEDISFEQIFNESIKCHHNDVSNYIQNNYLQNEKERSNDTLINCLKYYNFIFIHGNIDNETSFCYLCKYDYNLLVSILLKNKDIDINKKIVYSLYLAVEKENIDIVQLLLSNVKNDVNLCYKINSIEELNKESDIDHVIKKFTTEEAPLFVAIKNENLEIIKLLLSNSNIDVNFGYKRKIEKQKIRNNKTSIKIEEKSPLCQAIEIENIEIIEHLLKNEKIDVNFVYKLEGKGRIINEKDALYIAIEKENIKIVQHLLSCSNININHQNKLSKIWSLNEIIQEKDEELKELEELEENEYFISSPFGYEDDSYKYYDDGFEKDNQIEEDNKTSLCLAIEKENIEIIKLLLKNKNIDVNIPNIIIRNWRYSSDSDPESYNIRNIQKTPLCLAVEKENIEIIQLLLLNDKLDVNKFNIFIKSKARYDYYRGDEKYLRRYDEESKSTLCLAIEKEKIEIISLLLKNNKIDINLKEKLFNSWLYISLDFNGEITEGSYEDKMKGEGEKSPLYLAIEKENIEIIQLLLSNDKIDLNQFNNKNETKLMRPIYYENEKDEGEFMEQQLYIFDQYKNYVNNETALHFAVKKGNIEIVQLLLSKEKLDLNILYEKCGEYKTFIDLSEKNGEFIFPNKEFDIKIPDNSIKIMELEPAKILDLSNASPYIIDLNDVKEEKTALIIAIEHNFDKICKLLLSNERIDINCQSILKKKSKKYHHGEVIDDNLNHFYMPLHLAVTMKRMNIIQLLLDHKNINIDAKDENGKTPIELAEDEQIKKLFNAIEKH